LIFSWPAGDVIIFSREMPKKDSARRSTKTQKIVLNI
jgi:hypothetical protein